MIPIATRKLQLQTRLADLQGRMTGIEAELDSHDNKDWDDLAAERESDEVLEGMGVNAQHEVRMINAALERIEAGVYGVCVKCGDKISQERLDVLPFTPFCRKCAA
ncbi:MAG: TraR/DksA C4-type zinc finger protein [Cypionkella sp.]|nr:TraR/DksA C4-type zinc finger protein [Cypionkella sp.]